MSEIFWVLNSAGKKMNVDLFYYHLPDLLLTLSGDYIHAGKDR